MIQWLNRAIALVILIGICAVVWAWYNPKQTTSTDYYYPVPVEKKVSSIKKIFVPVSSIRIIAYEKEVIVEKLKLPDWVKDKDKQVILDGEIGAYKGKTSVVGVLDTKTGESTLIQKQLPISLFSFENDKEIGARMGMNMKAGRQIDIFGRYTFLRVGTMYVAGYGEVNTTPDGKVMVEASYRW
jgi:hypothetical protein